MIFEEPIHGINDKRVEQKQIFFFGGNEIKESKLNRRNQNLLRSSKLYELIINWDTSAARVKPQGIVLKVVEGVTFEGCPNFNSQFPSKYF